MKNKRYAESILDSLTEGVFTVDKDLNITFFNRAAERITGFNKNEALKSKCYEIFKANICKSGCFLRETMASGKTILDRRINIANKDGNIIPISVNTSVLTDDNKEMVVGIETFRDCRDIELLQKQLDQSYTFHDIIGKSPKIKDILAILPHIAQSASTVLIQGPSGSGKEVFAKAIHNLSKRKKGPFIAINCGAIPHNLLESELFGHVQGSFTDAKHNRHGKFKLAEGGTIFFDEIGELPLMLQVKLLRVIQEKEYEPVGGSRPHKADARIILATNRNLQQLVVENTFREDLYFRINVVKINLPPLSERREDIPLFVAHFIKLHNNLSNKGVENISGEVMRFFMQYPFSGNIRELQNIIEYVFILCDQPTIEMRFLPGEVVSSFAGNTADSMMKSSGDPPKDDTSRVSVYFQREMEMIRMTLEENKWSRAKTAEALGINASTLWRKMKQYQL
jgi:PAS domain S-box-containing protein